ncbi:hypothetical protein BDW62DRAFT_12145 [Aspergillus aurantiobrunneus]
MYEYKLLCCWFTLEPGGPFLESSRTSGASLVHRRRVPLLRCSFVRLDSGYGSSTPYLWTTLVRVFCLGRRLRNNRCKSLHDEYLLDISTILGLAILPVSLQKRI